MMRLYTVFCLLLSAPAAYAQMERHDEPILPEPWMFLDPAAKSTNPPLQDGFPNPSFEDIDGASQPLVWGRTGSPVLRTGDASDGIYYAWVHNQNRYFTRFAPSIPAWQTFVIGSMVKSEFGIEPPAISFNTSVNAIPETLTTSSVRAKSRPAGAWAPFYASQTRLPGGDDYLILLLGTQEITWVGFDDAFILFEDIPNGHFEAIETGVAERNRWSLSDGAVLDEVSPIIGNQSLRLDNGATASRLAAHAPEVVQYFLTGVSTGDFMIGEQRLDVGGDVLDVTGGVAVPDAEGRFFVELSETPNAHAARIVINNDTQEVVHVDDVSRGFAYAWPKTFEPVANSPRPTTRLLAAWPGKLDTATIIIRNGADDEVLVLGALQREETSAWIEFDGADLPAGDYVAEFVLADAEGVELRPRRTFTLRRPAPFPVHPTPVDFSEFVSTPWMFFNGIMPEASITTVEQAREWVRLAIQEDMFNLPFFYLDVTQFAPFLEALGETDVPFIIGSPQAAMSSTMALGNKTFDPGLALERLEILRPFFDLPNCVGVFIADEPAVNPPVVKWVERVMILMEEEGRNYPTPYSWLNVNSPHYDANFPLITAHYYPYFRDNRTSAESLLHYANLVENNHLKLARDRGLQFWGGMQGFARITGNVAASIPEANAQLGVNFAMGTDGYHAFMYSTIGTLAGIRTHTGAPMPRLEAFALNNALMEQPRPILSQERTAPPQTNMLARVATNTSGDSYAVVVNIHPDKILEMTALTSAPSVMSALYGSEMTPEGTQHIATLQPGEWDVFHFTNGIVPAQFTGVLTPVPPNRVAEVANVRTFHAGATPIGLSIEPNGERLGVLANTQARLYTIGESNFGQLQATAFAGAGLGRIRFHDAGTLGVGTRTFGLRIMNVLPEGLSERFVMHRATAAGVDAVKANDGLWYSAGSFYGINALQESGSTFQRIGIVPSDHNWFVSMHGPMIDGSVYTFEDTHGLHRVWYDGDIMIKERLTPANVYAEGSENPAGSRLASGRMDRGVEIFEFDETGMTEKWVLYDPEMVGMEKTAWLSDSILAAADVRLGVRFYRIHGPNSWTSLGLWRPREGMAVESIAAHTNGTIAIGLNGGEVFVANAQGVVGALDSSAWMLF